MELQSLSLVTINKKNVTVTNCYEINSKILSKSRVDILKSGCWCDALKIDDIGMFVVFTKITMNYSFRSHLQQIDLLHYECYDDVIHDFCPGVRLNQMKIYEIFVQNHFHHNLFIFNIRVKWLITKWDLFKLFGFKNSYTFL